MDFAKVLGIDNQTAVIESVGNATLTDVDRGDGRQVGDQGFFEDVGAGERQAVFVKLIVF